MILVDQERLDASIINEPNHKLYAFAKVYDDTLKDLRKRYKDGVLHFIRPDRPRKKKGADARGNEIPNASVPVEPTTIPLTANVVIDGVNGVHNWTVSMGAPKPIVGGLWEPTGRRTLILTRAEYSVDMNREPDLAFFLYKISKHTSKGRGAWKLKDPVATANEIAEKEGVIAQRKYAIWMYLKDEDKLRKLARAYGVPMVDSKLAPEIRVELEQQLVKNDELKKQNKAVKGTDDFLTEMDITFDVLLRNFARRMMDEKRLDFREDLYKVGTKVVLKVPAHDLKNPFEYLCQYLSAPNQSKSLQEFVKDLIYKEYIGETNADGEYRLKVDRQELVWLADIMGEAKATFKSNEELQKKVEDFFCPV